MSAPAPTRPARSWHHHDAAWRDPAQVVAQCAQASPVAPALLRCETQGDWLGVLERLDACLVVSREYEHLLLALTVTPTGPRRSFMVLPHPSGLAFDAATGRLHVASTRNPNQLYALTPIDGGEENGRVGAPAGERPLAPLSVSFLPGRLYLHNLALVGGALHGAAVGLDAIVRFTATDSHKVAWWPRSIEREGRPTSRATTCSSTPSRPGRACRPRSSPPPPTYPPRVVFSGATREPVVRGLTRPPFGAAARRRAVGERQRLRNGRDRPQRTVGAGRAPARLDPRTDLLRRRRVRRNLARHPRYAQYAPGLDIEHSVCGVHVLDIRSGEVLGSIVLPAANQIFEIAVLPRTTTLGFPATAGRSQRRRALDSFFYSYRIPDPQEPYGHWFPFADAGSRLMSRGI